MLKKLYFNKNLLSFLETFASASDMCMCVHIPTSTRTHTHPHTQSVPGHRQPLFPIVSLSVMVQKKFESHYPSWLPWWLSGRDSFCQRRRHRRCAFDPWVGKVPWRRKWQPVPVFLPGKSHGWRSHVGGRATVHGVTEESVTT